LKFLTAIKVELKKAYLEEDKKRNSRNRISLGYFRLFFSFNLQKKKNIILIDKYNKLRR
jgi:hypothetical protein